MADTQLSPEVEVQIERLRGRLPPGVSSRALLLSVLEFLRRGTADGELNDETLAQVAARLELPVAEVRAVATFDAERPTAVARAQLRICGGLSCSLAGAGALLQRCRMRLGVEEGQATIDGAVAVSSSNCQMACDVGPVATLTIAHAGEGWQTLESLDDATLGGLLDALEEGRLPAEWGE